MAPQKHQSLLDNLKPHRRPMMDTLEPRRLYAVSASVGGDIPMHLPFENGQPAYVTAGYDSSNHAGYAVDFRASEGTRLAAPFTGVVEAVGTYSGISTTGVGLTATQQLGRYVLIRGTGATANWRVWLAHLSSPAVTPGQSVVAGQYVGLSGQTGWSNGPHLHMQVQNVDGTKVRPVMMYGTESGTNSRLITDFVAGRTYTAINVGPDNDHFVRAATITGTGVCVIGSNDGATQEPGEPVYFGSGGSSVFYKWTAPTNGTFVFDTIGTGFDTVLSVSTGSSVSGQTTIARDDDSGGNLTSKVTIAGNAGQTYRIAVNGYSGQMGTFRLNVSGSSPASIQAAPTNLTSTRAAAGQVRLNWMNNGAATTSNELQYRSGSSWITFATLSAATNSVLVNASAGSSWELRVVAVGPLGRGDSGLVLALF